MKIPGNPSSSITCLLFLLLFFTACSSSKDEIILNTEPVNVTKQKIMFTPKTPLRAEGHSDRVCMEIPNDFKQDPSSWSMLSGDGVRTVPYATLITTTGINHDFYQRSFLNSKKKYICLSSDVPIKPGTEFRQITIWSNLPFWTDEIIWLNSNKM